LAGETEMTLENPMIEDSFDSARRALSDRRRAGSNRAFPSSRATPRSWVVSSSIWRNHGLRNAVLLSVALFVSLSSASAIDKPDGNPVQLPPMYIPSGSVMYKQYCAACHGVDTKGGGPAASSLKMPPPDLTTLANRHNGKFPDDYVSDVLLLGPIAAHGSAAMPTWGPLFSYLDKHSESAVRQRIKKLSDYLASLQVGQEPQHHETS
jgi:mono/diheme cytochrome c family protein